MAKSSEKLEYLNKNHWLEDGLTLWYPPPRLLPFEFPPEMTHTSHHIARPTSGNHHKLCCYVYIYMIFMLNVPSWCEKGAGVRLSLKCASLKIKPFHRFLFGAFFSLHWLIAVVRVLPPFICRRNFPKNKFHIAPNFRASMNTTKGAFRYGIGIWTEIK